VAVDLARGSGIVLRIADHVVPKCGSGSGTADWWLFLKGRTWCLVDKGIPVRVVRASGGELPLQTSIFGLKSLRFLVYLWCRRRRSVGYKPRRRSRSRRRAVWSVPPIIGVSLVGETGRLRWTVVQEIFRLLFGESLRALSLWPVCSRRRRRRQKRSVPRRRKRREIL